MRDRQGLFIRIAQLAIISIVTVVVGSATLSARFPQDNVVVTRLLADGAVQAARRAIVAMEPHTIETQIAICEVPAPPFAEGARARQVQRLFTVAGLQKVRIDEIGNVIGEVPGAVVGAPVIVSAHLDTVFPAGTDVHVSRKGTVLTGPGIGDDCRGLAVLVALAQVFVNRRLPTDSPVVLVATVGEEGLGDLRGVRHLFQGLGAGRVRSFVSLDGGGLGIVARGVGSLRYRVTFSGPGGHSYGNFGIANPIHALGRAAAAIAALQVPVTPRTTFNIGRIGGGTSVNAIASEAWMEVDLRSSDAAVLDDLDRRFRACVDRAVAEENSRWAGKSPVAAAIQRTGARPTGATGDDAPLLRRAILITQALGTSSAPTEGSTDANVAMSLGIPALTLGAGGTASGAHSPSERFDVTGAGIGAERALLVALAAASDRD